jgi:hypothetical protein
MDITENFFKIFDRNEFSFQKIKTLYPEDEVEMIKEAYKRSWNTWKATQLEAFAELDQLEYFGKPKVQSWTNGWNLRSHFWCVYRSRDAQNHNATLAVLANKKQIQIYLMYQHYHSEKRAGKRSEYNAVLPHVPQWAQTIDATQYRIWPREESEYTTHLPLVEYLADSEKQTELAQLAADSSFQIGKVFPRNSDFTNFNKEIVKTIVELLPLYQQIVENYEE